VTQQTEHALVKRILAGNREACVEFVALHHAPIYRLLVHLARDSHFAEDLTQETFLAAWAKIGSFNRASSLNTWLHKIAYRKFLDSHRRQQRSVVTQSDATLAEARSSVVDPYASALAADENRHLYLALDRLPPPEREVVVLHYLQNLSYAEMAEVLEQPSGTIKWRTAQALEHLRELLEAKGKP
jgi:RNA polymerase sigma-70 factor, ECF subfamily